MIMIWLTLAAAVLAVLVWAVAAVMWWVVVPAARLIGWLRRREGYPRG
jgi:hypothetical protein